MHIPKRHDPCLLNQLWHQCHMTSGAHCGWNVVKLFAQLFHKFKLSV